MTRMTRGYISISDCPWPCQLNTKSNITAKTIICVCLVYFGIISSKATL